MAQSNCKLAIKLDNNQNAIYVPGQLISGLIVQSYHEKLGEE